MYNEMMPPDNKTGQIMTKAENQASVQPIRQRDLVRFEAELIETARKSGEAFFYSWALKDGTIVSGPSIALIMEGLRRYGNCSLEVPQPAQVSPGRWLYLPRFIDFQNNFTMVVPYLGAGTITGRYDSRRLEEMQFSLHLSKAIRNLGRRVLPAQTIEAAVKAAKGKVRLQLEQRISRDGLDNVKSFLFKKFKEQGIEKDGLLKRFGGKDKLTISNMVEMVGLLNGLLTGFTGPEEIQKPKFKSGPEPLPEPEPLLEPELEPGPLPELEPEPLPEPEPERIKPAPKPASKPAKNSVLLKAYKEIYEKYQACEKETYFIGILRSAGFETEGEEHIDKILEKAAYGKDARRILIALQDGLQ